MMLGNCRPNKSGGDAMALVSPLFCPVECYAFASVSDVYNICIVNYVKL